MNFFLTNFDAIKTFKYWFTQNCWFYKQKNFFKMMLEFRKDWKDLTFVGRYNLLNGRFLHHLSTKILHLIIPLMISAAQFSSKMLKHLNEQSFCRKVSMKKPWKKHFKNLLNGRFFTTFVNNSLKFKCSIHDIGTTNFF